MAEKIIQNAAFDADIGVYYNSTHVHDYVGFKHRSKHHFIDGGREYLRRSFFGNDKDHNIMDWSLYEDDPRHIIMRRYLWGTRGPKNNIIWIPLWHCTTNHLRAILKTQKHISVFLKDLIKEILDFRSKNTDFSK